MRHRGQDVVGFDSHGVIIVLGFTIALHLFRIHLSVCIENKNTQTERKRGFMRDVLYKLKSNSIESIFLG
jgi:hypothetical protein